MKRLWMLLCLSVLMLVIMAVPAMAAEHEHATCNYGGELCADCAADDHAGWTSLASVEGDTLTAGKYYVPAGGFSGSFTVSSGDVVICLNGNTWQGVDTRTLTVSGGATVTIVDCGQLLEGNQYITAGTINGVQLYTSTKGDTTQKAADSEVRGGTIFVEYGTVNFYNGTITGGTAINGGNVALCGTSGQKAFFYLNGGQILGAGKDNYVSTASNATTVKSLAGGGIANNRGGNVYVRGYAEFHMGSDLTARIGDGSAVPLISGGNTLCGQGGNVSVSSPSGGTGSFHMHSGAMTDGHSTDNGGNFHLEFGQFTISGGQITGGMRRNVATDIYSNGFHNTGTLTMSGGQITGGYLALNNAYTSDAKTLIRLSGSARITGTGLTLQYNSGTASNVYKGIPVIRVGDFEEGANIVVAVKTTDYFTNDDTLPKDTRLVKDTASDSAKNFMTRDMTGDGAVTWADYQDATRYIHGKAGNCTVTFESDGIYLRAVGEDIMYHCVCCGNVPANIQKAGKIVHASTCDTYDHAWNPYPIGDNTVLPGATTGSSTSNIQPAGYYYLVESDALEEGATAPDGKVQWTKAQNNYIGTGAWYIDFNGLTIEANRRLVSFHNDTDTDLVLTNSQATGGITWSGTYADHSCFWIRRVAATDANSMNKALGIYRLTIDASDFTINKKLFAFDTGTASFYACTISGATATAESGGVIYAGNASNVKLDSCTITGGNAQLNGGGICFESTGSLTIASTTLSGGTAQGQGGNLYISKGNATIEDSTIAGRAVWKGGNLTLAGNVTIENRGNGLDSGLLMTAGNKLTFRDLSSDSDIVLCMEEASVGTELSNAAEGLNEKCFSLVGVNLYLTVEAGVLKVTDIAPENVKLLHNGKGLDAWPSQMNDDDILKLLADMEGANVSAHIILDLNGHSLTGLTAAQGVEISLYDSSAIDYSVPTGSVTLAEGQANPFARQMRTGAVTGTNMRFVTIRESSGSYTAHQLQLAIESTVLYPRRSSDQAALGYRIALRCDDALAGYVSQFGLQIAGDREPVDVPSTSPISGQGVTNDNSRIIAVNYDPNAVTSEVAEGILTGSAYVKFTDGTDVLTGATSRTNLKTVVETVCEKFYSFDSDIQDRISWMTETYASVMEDWDTTPKGTQAAFDALEGKKVLFIGNSYTYWGNCTINVSNSIRDQASRTGDKGLFYQLCKENGLDVEVTTWVFGSHDITDSMGTSCTVCEDKVNHLSYLTDPYFDYVFMQPFFEAEYAGDIVTHLRPIMEFFRKANPNVKFLFNVPHMTYDRNFVWKNELSSLTEIGVTVCNWGGMINDILKNDLEVPGGLMTYSRSSFVISRNDTDGHHQNMLSGYLTALMAYCAITGDSAEGQPYAFVDDPTIHPNFDLEKFMANNYTYTPGDDPKGYWTDGFVATNFVEIMRSAPDMKGLQQLVDVYIAKFNTEAQ